MLFYTWFAQSLFFKICPLFASKTEFAETASRLCTDVYICFVAVCVLALFFFVYLGSSITTHKGLLILLHTGQKSTLIADSGTNFSRFFLPVAKTMAKNLLSGLVNDGESSEGSDDDHYVQIIWPDVPQQSIDQSFRRLAVDPFSRCVNSPLVRMAWRDLPDPLIRAVYAFLSLDDAVSCFVCFFFRFAITCCFSSSFFARAA